MEFATKLLNHKKKDKETAKKMLLTNTLSPIILLQ